MLIKKSVLLIIVIFFSVPFSALAVNDVTISDDTNFELNTSDTAVSTTIVASAGGQVTNLNVESNYIDITLDNLSSVIFTTTVGGQYLKITKQSGSNNYTVNPTCPTNTVTLTGTGATVVLRLEIDTTDDCVAPPSPTPPPVISNPTGQSMTVCPQGEIYSNTTGKLCTSWIATNQTPFTCEANTTSATIYTFTLTMKIGSTGFEVKKLQEVLNLYDGATLTPDGNFGRLTEATVKSFQLKKGLVADGIVGPITHSALNALQTTVCENPAVTINETITGYTFTLTIKLGSTGLEVKKLQEVLNIYAGATLVPDGNFGPLTKSAVVKFQTSKGLVADGIVGPKTRAALNSIQ